MFRIHGFWICALSVACGGAASEPDSAAQLPSMATASEAMTQTPGPGVSRANTETPGAGPAVAGAAAAASSGRRSPAALMPTSGSGAGTAAAGASLAGAGSSAGAAAGAPGGGSSAGADASGAAGAAAASRAGAQADDPGLQPSATAMGPLFPANGATDVCPDVSLRLRFDDEPRVGSGKISVFEAGGAQPVASVDVAAAQTRQTVGGAPLVFPQPVFVVDHEVIVGLPAPLRYGTSYTVKVDAGAIRGSGGASGLAGEWQFSTRSGPPADASQLRVALDGTGDFCSVQSALEAAPSGGTVQVGAGFYHELIHVSGKVGVTLRGDDRKTTVILGVNNERLNGGTANRALVNIEKSAELTLERLTIHNLTEQGGSQAEALRLQDCDKCVVRDAAILSLQDTLLWSGRIYAKDCYIAGNVDFVWGKGAVYFDGCEIKTVGRKGYVVQSRNTPEGYGYVFVDSKITADPGVTGIVLARIDVSAYPGSHVAYINCQMGNHIAPEGWTITGGLAGSSLRFWEYQSTDTSGAPLDVSRRHPSSRQISADQAATMRDPSQVLGGWAPPQ